MRYSPLPWRRWLLLIGAGLALVAAAAACGGGGGKSLSAEDYFKKVEAISNEAIEKESAAAPSDEEAANLTPEELKQRGIEFLSAAATITEDAIQKVEALEVPDDLRDGHDDLVAAGNDLAKTYRDLADEAQDVAPEDIEDFFNSKVFAESTFAKFDEACSGLEKLAGDKGIEVDLNCTE